MAVKATALAAWSEVDRLQKRKTRVKATRTPGTITPHSCPYCPRMPQPMPPAAAPISGAAKNNTRDEAVFSSMPVSWGFGFRPLVIVFLLKIIVFGAC